MSTGAPRRNGGGGRSSSRSNNNGSGGGGRGGGGHTGNSNSTASNNNNNTYRGGRNPRRGPGRPKGRAGTDETTLTSNGTAFARDEVSSIKELGPTALAVQQYYSLC
jgi:hypothetical protein